METETKKEGNSTLPAPSGPSSAATSIDEYDEGSLESEFSNFASIDMADIIVELEQCHTIAIKEPALVNKMDTSASHYQLRDLLHFSSIGSFVLLVSGVLLNARRDTRTTQALHNVVPSPYEFIEMLTCKRNAYLFVVRFRANVVLCFDEGRPLPPYPSPRNRRRQQQQQ
jgi:hypothetical protein